MNKTSPRQMTLQDELPARILVADDDSMMQTVVSGALASRGHDVVVARNGSEALNIIRREADRIDIIILDRHMPGAGGIDIVRELKGDDVLRHIPVIMQTSAGKPEEIREGIEAGVYYYLTKPFSNEVLQSIVTSAVRGVRRRKDLQHEMRRNLGGFGLLDSAVFSFRTLDDAKDVACLAAHFFPDPEEALEGLHALLVNAVEHGALGVGYALKTELLAQGKWRSEIERRECQQENVAKTATLSLRRQADEVSATVTDQGAGFNWKNYLRLDHSRALDSHGRGIARAAAVSFDTLEYNDKGNSVTATVKV